MKILAKTKSKLLVLLTTLVLSIVSIFAGASVLDAQTANADSAGMTYVDTEVASINFFASSRVIFAFCLTESDYDDFEMNWENFPEHGNFAEGTAKYDYITSLSYWKNFKEMNSEGVYFNQTFAYWNGGFADSSIGSKGKNAVAHLTNLENLEYGFMIYIPAGTTFPSLTYVQSNCTGTPTAYKTKTDAAFYYNGTSFVKTSYDIVTKRSEATAILDATDLSLYYSAEQTLVNALINDAKTQLKQALSSSAVESVLSNFNVELKKITTKEDYAKIDAKKAEGKSQIAALFDSLAQNNYGEIEAAKLALIKAESDTLIDSAKTVNGVDEIVAGIKYKAEEILTEEEKPAFAQFVAAAVKNVQDAFVASLYRETEAAQGAALVENGKKALEQATTYGEAEALELSYLAEINALKTAAEWEAEEEANAQKNPQSPQPEQPNNGENVDNSKGKKSGCNSSVVENWTVISMALAFTLVVILKNKKRTDI